jgi:asparagine synthase (glutamine-hydrolysing)
MCGIAAILKSKDTACPASVVERMRDEVAYRGPDDKGSIFLANQGSGWTQVPPSGSGWQVGLGHRRLSILDLSSAGHQPMLYEDKFWIVYNGEIYNYLELRKELERVGHHFRSSSDTEVILAAYAEWGPACFSRFRGMWGLVIVDCHRNEAILCRDRLGIKPLYLWQSSGMVAVASEIKQFLALPGFKARLEPAVAAEYIRTGYEDPKLSFFRNVHPIEAGSWLKFSLGTLKPSGAESYWHPERVQVSVTDAEEAGRAFAGKLQECVKIHLRSDVPVGCALSGGLDSSSVALLADGQRNGAASALHTFTVTFPGHHSDERTYVDAVLSHAHASPHFVTPTPEGFLEDLDRFLWIHDEPVGGFSQYAGYSVARLTRQAGVPVSLNGQGGDEILSGYWQTYFVHLRDLWRQGRLLELTKHFSGALLGNGNPTLVTQIPAMVRRYRARTKPALQVLFPDSAIKNRGEVLRNVLAMTPLSRRVHEIRFMFLPQLLKWDDRNFMAFSVESRYPFLDHELIELCLSFDPRVLYHHGWVKYPLRRGLGNLLPPAIVHRRSKFGFETPQDEWLTGFLRPKLEQWFRDERPVWDYVDRGSARSLATDTWRREGKYDEHCKDLFRIFVFDRWLDIFSVQA